MAVKHAFRQSDGNGRPGWVLKIAYDLDQITDLKKAVRWQDRYWNQDLEQWWFLATPEYEDKVEQIFPDFFAYRAQPQLF